MGGAPAAELPSLAGSIVLSFVSLGLVCLLAYVALKWLARRGVGRAEGPLQVIARCPLEPRRSVYVVRAAGRCFLLGVGEGPMSLLAELDPAAVEASAAAAEPTGGLAWNAVLARVLGTKRDAK
jgi:flagellar biosynthetic protein FliO